MSDYLFDLLGVRERLIMDPVHGGITLFGHEVQVIDHPLFQRLRYICQNDILSLVFPGATHSRFLHSIGTLHVGSRMYQSLIESSLRKYRDQRQSSLSVAQLKAIAYMAKVVRLACLLHDCGHSSFSHQFTESVTIRSLLAEPGRFEKLWGGVNFRAYHQCQPAQLEHEHYSVRCAYEIMNSVQSDLVQGIRDDVLTLMDTTDTTPSEAFIHHAHHLWPVLTRQEQAPANAGVLCAELLSLLISGEIDADRADYMLRDGFHSSVTLGGFNLDHLLKNVHVGWSPDCEWLGLGITRKGLGTLEDFVYSRYQMYRKVYGHKTSIGFDWLLRRAIDEVLEDQESRLYIDHCLASMQGFQTLTDNYFWEAFRRHAERYPDSASYDLVYRKRLQHPCFS
jgi:HD superfamily phosphohydrolase